MVKEISIAPMVGYTNVLYRTLARFLGRRIVLFTEMAKAMDKVPTELPKELSLSPNHFPTVAQIGGNNPKILSEWVKRIQELGFAEININIGCPGKTTTEEGFGACLMQNPHLTAQIFKEVSEVALIPISIKCRIGINDNDHYEFFRQFVKTTYDAGCEKFYIHARKAILNGITTHLENRTIPPLKYNYVKKIKEDFGKCTFIVNGGINSFRDIEQYLGDFDGLMIGRGAYNDYRLVQYSDHLVTGKSYIQTFNNSAHFLTEHLVPVYKEYLENFELKKDFLSECIKFARMYFSEKQNIL